MAAVSLCRLGRGDGLRDAGWRGEEKEGGDARQGDYKSHEAGRCGVGVRGGSTVREVPRPPRPAYPTRSRPRSAPRRARRAAPLQHARRMLASCSGRKGPEGRYPLHYLVWHNRARDLDRELSAKQVGWWGGEG